MNSNDLANKFRHGVEVSYYIPGKLDPVTRKLTPVFPNPSPILRHFAFRIDGSVWMMDESRVPQKLFADMMAAGCTVNVIRYDEAEREKILKRAREVLEQEVNRVRTELENSLKKAQKNFDKAKQLQDTDLVNDTTSYVKVTFWRTKKLLVAAEEAALSFDILRDAEELFAAVNKEIAAKQELFYVEHAIKTGRGRKKKEVTA